MIKIVSEEISFDDLVKSSIRPQAGAVVTFLGVVRDDGILGMEVESFSQVAQAELEQIAAEAVERFGVISIDIVHKVGSLKVGDPIVFVACTSGHRKEAFLACSYLIDELKERAPIWKKELRPTGDRWVGL